MKLTKIFYGNQYVTSFHCGKTKWQVFKWKMKTLFKRLVIASFLVGIVYGSFQIGKTTTTPVTAFVDRPVTVEVEKDAPVLKRIAKCESGDSHFDKNGQVLMRSNTNKSVDVGRYQINTVWFKKATELGFDITKESDNEKMAQWIYKNRGTEDWKYSRECWMK